MSRRAIELTVGLGLLLGPLGYALTLDAETVVVQERVVMAGPACETEPVRVVPVQVPPTPETVIEPEPEPTPNPEVVDEPDPDTRIAFAFVNDGGIVLSTMANRSWGKGRIRRHAGPGEYRAAKRADARVIPETLWAQRGRTFDLYGDSGKLCTVRIGELSVLAQHNGPTLYDVFHPEGDASEDYDFDYDAFDRQDHPPKAIRSQVWANAGDEDLWLVAEPVGDPSCEGALWARDSELPEPTVLRPSDAPSQLTRDRIAQFEASESRAQTQHQYEQWYAELGDDPYEEDWATVVSENPATVRTWIDADGTTTLLELTFGYQGASCGDGYDSSIEHFEAVADGALSPIEFSVNPLAVFDADLDGSYEMIYDSDHGGPNWMASETMERGWSIDEAFYCPC